MSPKALHPRDVIKFARDHGFDVRNAPGSRIVISQPGSKTRPLAISFHNHETYDKGVAASIRQWFREHGHPIE